MTESNVVQLAPLEPEDNRNLLDVLIKNAKAPTAEQQNLLKLAETISKTVGYDEPLLPHHEEEIAKMFKKRQHGYGRTAYNLAHEAHASVQNERSRQAVQRIMREESAASLSGYTAQEIDDLKTAMRERWKQLGKKMRELKGKDDDGARKLKDDRTCINRALWWIERGKLPIYLTEYRRGAEDILAPFHARYEMWKTDDAAMNAEFKRRVEIRLGRKAA